MHTCKVSVRDLVEFILRSGDIVSSSTGIRDTDAMQEGTRIHKKLQKQMGSQYHAEVPLKYTSSVCYDNLSFAISVEGRADGIFPKALLPRLYDFADFSSEIPLENEAEHTHPIIPCRTIIHDDSEAPTDFIDEIKGIYRNVHNVRAHCRSPCSGAVLCVYLCLAGTPFIHWYPHHLLSYSHGRYPLFL